MMVKVYYVYTSWKKEQTFIHLMYTLSMTMVFSFIKHIYTLMLISIYSYVYIFMFSTVAQISCEHKKEKLFLCRFFFYFPSSSSTKMKFLKRKIIEKFNVKKICF